MLTSEIKERFLQYFGNITQEHYKIDVIKNVNRDSYNTKKKHFDVSWYHILTEDHNVSYFKLEDPRYDFIEDNEEHDDLDG